MSKVPEKTFSDNIFIQGYLDLLRRQYGTKRVRANQVYQEYIKDKEHIHMNSTKWYTLTGFIQYLAKAGFCRVDQNERGPSVVGSIS